MKSVLQNWWQQNKTQGCHASPSSGRPPNPSSQPEGLARRVAVGLHPPPSSLLWWWQWWAVVAGPFLCGLGRWWRPCGRFGQVPLCRWHVGTSTTWGGQIWSLTVVGWRLWVGIEAGGGCVGWRAVWEAWEAIEASAAPLLLLQPWRRQQCER
jgi:hypothetical protein